MTQSAPAWAAASIILIASSARRRRPVGPNLCNNLCTRHFSTPPLAPIPRKTENSPPLLWGWSGEGFFQKFLLSYSGIVLILFKVIKFCQDISVLVNIFFILPCRRNRFFTRNPVSILTFDHLPQNIDDPFINMSITQRIYSCKNACRSASICCEGQNLQAPDVQGSKSDCRITCQVPPAFAHIS